MPVATSMGELENMLRTELRVAMQEVRTKDLEDMLKETQRFYTIGNPRIYQRTGALGSSPRTTPLSGGGNTVSFEAYLNQNQGWYGRGNPNPAFTSRGYASYFSPLQILNAAEYHFARVKGRPGFWHRSELRFQINLDRTLATHFN